MKAIILTLILALITSLISWIVIRRAKQQFQARMRRIRTMAAYRQLPMSEASSYGNEPLEGYTDSIGDTSCQFNACSPYLRCAINPSGPCDGCSYYEAKQLNDS